MMNFVIEKKRLVFVILFGIFSILNAEILWDQDRELFEQLLLENNQAANSTDFLKDWSADTKFKIPAIVDVINEPFKFPILADEFKKCLENETVAEFLSKSSKILYQTDFAKTKNYGEVIDQINSPKDVFNYVELVWKDTEKDFRNAFELLSQDEIDKLKYIAYSIHMEEADTLRYQKFFQDQNIQEFEIDDQEFSEIIAKVDFKSLMNAAYQQQIAFDLIKDFLLKRNWEIDEPITYNSDFGKMIIGSDNIDIYQENYVFILDCSGDDIYKSALSSKAQNPFYWVIDLAGNDFYCNQEPGGMFSALLGLGYSFDADGHDIYQAGDYSFSSFFGYNFHQDYCGDDLYQMGLHSGGAASFGISILQNELGNDVYKVTELGEGFGSTLALGVLHDKSGNDLYYAGGKYLHEPLAPYDYRSLAQGFGYGMRPNFAGGIGLLFDQSGNDRYDGGVYAQGVGYWYSLGILLDNEGNDYYNAVYYPQGSGIHLAGGFLYDGKGEDSYYSKHGPGQGAGHDYGVGILFDIRGDDAYSVEGGNGLGISNGVGIFLDGSGNDRYERNGDGNYGVGKLARGSGSLGLFIDKGGCDSYNDSICADEKSWRKNKYGFGKDMLLTNPLRSIKLDAEKRAAEIDSLASIAEIFAIAAGWQVGNNTDSVAKAAEILLKRDTEAAEYISKNQMSTKSGLTWRAISRYAKKSSAMENYYPQLLANSDSLIVKNTIALIGITKNEKYFSEFKIFLQDGKYTPQILSALGNFDNEKSLEILAEYYDDESEKIRVITARSLKKISNPKAREILKKMKNDDSWLIRSLIENLD